MSLPSELLPIENVLIDLDVSSKKRLFEEIAQVFSENNRHIPADKVFQGLLDREKLGSTGLGSGVAIPHGRIAGLPNAIACFVRLKNPVDFNSQDGKPVNLILVLLVPEESNTEHLKILSHLAQKFSDRKTRDKLQVAQTADTVVDLILRN